MIRKRREFLIGRRYPEDRRNPADRWCPADRTFRDILERFLEWIWPYRCPVCEKVLLPEEGLVCEECRKILPWTGKITCMKCGRPLEKEEQQYCGNCQASSHLFVRGVCALVYEKQFRKSVLRMKFHNRRIYLPFFAEAMTEGIGQFLTTVRPAVLVPVPAHPRKRRARGFDQCALLTALISEKAGIPMQEHCLVRLKYTKPQKGLSREQRRGNVAGAFAARQPELLKEPVLLIDDIYTTGATIDACCAALAAVGIRNVYFAALCTEREVGQMKRPHDPSGEESGSDETSP